MKKSQNLLRLAQQALVEARHMLVEHAFLYNAPAILGLPQKQLAEDKKFVQNLDLHIQSGEQLALAALQAELAAEQRQQIAIIKWALTHAVTSPHTSTLDQGCSDKDTRLLQTQLYLQHHIEHYICDITLKNSATTLTNNIESIAQRALPSV